MSPFGTVPPSHFPLPITRPLALVIDRVEPPVPFENNETQVFFQLINNTAQEVSGVVAGIQGSYQITALAPHATVSGSLTTIAPAAGKNKVSEQVLNAIFPAYSGIWKLGDQLTEWFNSFIVTNCDGPVAMDIIVLLSTFLDQATSANRGYRETRRYPGFPSPALCGDTSEYYVTWSVFRFTSGPS